MFPMSSYFLTPIGEDSIVICNDCDYCANMEAAENIVENETEDYAGTYQSCNTWHAYD